MKTNYLILGSILSVILLASIPIANAAPCGYGGHRNIMGKCVKDYKSTHWTKGWKHGCWRNAKGHLVCK